MKRTPLKKIGERGITKQEFRKECRKAYFLRWGSMEDGIMTAPCQCCGLPMSELQADAAHKTPAGMGGAWRNDTPENIVVVHGHRAGLINCHAFCDRNFAKRRRNTLKMASVDCLKGGKIDWGPQDTRSLKNYLQNGTDEEMSI